MNLLDTDPLSYWKRTTPHQKVRPDRLRTSDDRVMSG